MITKARLGTGYLVAVGVGLAGLVASGTLAPEGTASAAPVVAVPFGAFSAVALSFAFVITGVWLGRSDLSEESIWKVAQWGTLGLGVPTLVVVLLATFRYRSLVVLGWRTVAINNVAVGGIVGILVGSVTELRRANERSALLNERNAVFNRVLRHDIRNSMNLVEGHLERIESGEGDVERSAEVIRDQVDHVVRLSRAARRLDRLNDDRPLRTVDLTSLVAERVEAFREAHPDAEVDADLRDVRVRGDDLLGSVVDDLLSNAAEHTDGTPRVRVAVDRVDGGGTAELRVSDDGPGFPERELDVHAGASETDLRHSDGVDLWLSKWIVETYDGDLVLENDERGARVRVRLPTGEP
ncbi:MAG: sensor histidine kinase [Haloferacaceae archaeon]